MAQQDLAIFDFDGTIADSAGWFFSIMNDIAEKHGFPHISEEERELLRGYTTQKIISHLGIPLWKIPIIANDLRKLAADHIDQISLFPWVSDIWNSLKKHNISIAIVSSNSEQNIRHVIGDELSGMVEHFATGASLFGKTAKIKGTIKSCNSSPGKTTSIGDEIRDIEAANSAGVSSIAVTWGYATTQALRTAGPTQLINQPNEILDWFNLQYN
ncbi:MAG: HAD hydrolase-like protein [Methyloligellaceae bacterium]